MELWRDSTKRRSASVQREAGPGPAFAWDESSEARVQEQRSFAAARPSISFQRDARPWFETDEWNRLPWLPDVPRVVREEFDPALPLWVFVATFLVASASYSAGRASIQSGTQGSRILFEAVSQRSSLVGGLFGDPRDIGASSASTAESKQLPPISRMPAEERQRVAIELSFAQATTSGAFDPTPEPNAPY